MTLSINDYESVKWVISRNANEQAKYDADRMPIAKAYEYVTDPFSYEHFTRAINGWKKGSKAQLIFTRADRELVNKLSAKQRDVLIDHWAFQFFTKTMQLLRERLDNEQS